MSKKVLGRGLRELLPARGIGAGKPASTVEAVREGRELGPGLRVLVVKDKKAERGDQDLRRGGFKPFGVAAASLLLGDVAILALVIAGRSHVEPRGWHFSNLLWIVAVIVGAWLGFLGTWLCFRRN